jgi:hypothetical protein
MVRPSLAALLAASQRSDTLDKPVQAGVSNADAWPRKEHESLKAAQQEDDFFTDLMLVLQFNQVDLKRELQDIPHKGRSDFKKQHENALSYRIEGTTTNRSSLYNFEQRLRQIKVKVVEHVQDCLTAMTPTHREKSLFTSSQASSGAVSQDANLRVSRRLHAIVSPILAESLLEEGTDEDQKVKDIILIENNLKNATSMKPVTAEKIKRECIEYKKTLSRMRELFTHYLLYAFGILCQPQTVDQLKVLQ